MLPARWFKKKGLLKLLRVFDECVPEATDALRLDNGAKICVGKDGFEKLGDQQERVDARRRHFDVELSECEFEARPADINHFVP